MRFQDKFYPKALQHSLQDFLTDGHLCDVTLVVDGHEFQAHKLVLSAASPYFRIMFNSESSFIESKQDKVNLYGIDGDALLGILNFIYSSDIEINDENVYSLMEATNLLQIHALRKSWLLYFNTYRETNQETSAIMLLLLPARRRIVSVKFCMKVMHQSNSRLCTSLFQTFISFYLQSSLSVENCLHLYVMASLHQYHDLANIAFHFLLINFSKVVDKEEFLELPFEILLEIISSRLLDVPNEEILYEHVLKWVKADVENRKQHLDLLIPEIDLHLISTDCLARIESDPLVSNSLRKKIADMTNYSSTSGMMFVFGKEKRYFYQKFRYKAEKAVIFAIGGESSGMASQSVECFTLGYDKWRYIVPECIIKRHETKHTNVLPPLRCARYHAASANDAYNVYVIGGRNSTSFLDECEVFNVRTNQWKYFHRLPVKLFASGAVFLENELIVVGGFSEEGILDKVWKLDKQHKSWVSMPPLNSPRFFHAAVAVGGYIFVLGGYDSKKQPALRTCEKFDPSCNKWFEISSMHEARAKFGCAAVDEYIYVFGGTFDESDCMKSVERYNILTNEWSFESSMTIPRHSFSVAVSDHEIYCLGGSDCTHFLDTVEKFSLRTKRWHCVHSMQISRLAPAAAALLVPYTSKE